MSTLETFQRHFKFGPPSQILLSGATLKQEIELCLILLPTLQERFQNRKVNWAPRAFNLHICSKCFFPRDQTCSIMIAIETSRKQSPKIASWHLRIHEIHPHPNSVEAPSWYRPNWLPGHVDLDLPPHSPWSLGANSQADTCIVPV